jgi:RNA polymerase sigma-70 factor, ECF subfamily
MLLENASDLPSMSLPEQVTFEAAFRAHAPYVWRLLRRLGLRETEAEDGCQEVFLVVHKKLSAFRGSTPLRTWIYAIATRVASEQRRRPYRRHEELAGDDLPERSAPASQEDDVELRRALDRLDLALDRLDHDKRAVFVLFEIEEMPMAEVAATVGCPLQTAYARLYAARRIVQEEMTGAGSATRPPDEGATHERR